MSEHLPECPTAWMRDCICTELRLCEQRIREEWYEVQSETWEQGYRHGLDKAREAVAKIPKEDGGYCHVLHACDVEAVLDDLRVEKK